MGGNEALVYWKEGRKKEREKREERNVRKRDKEGAFKV